MREEEEGGGGFRGEGCVEVVPLVSLSQAANSHHRGKPLRR